MAAEYPTSIEYFRDLGAAINQRIRGSSLNEGILYLSGSVEHATDTDNALVRESFKVRALVNTSRKRQIKIFSADDDLKRFDETQWRMSLGIVDLLGLKYCAVSLRTPTYMEKQLKRIPFWLKAKMVIHHGESEADAEEGRRRVGNIGHINESIDVLDYSTESIQDVFNEVLLNPKMYPMLICGGNYLRDQHLLVLLMFLLLDIPTEAFEEYYVAAVESITHEEVPPGSEDFILHITTARHEWVHEVKKHLDLKYGGTEAYLVAIGVKKDAKSTLQGILLGHA